MKIKMLTTKCGPDPTENWLTGDERDVSVEEARYWHAANVCTPLEPYPADAQKAVVSPPQKAVAASHETAKVIVGRQAVAPPAASAEDVKINLAPAWGKK